MLQRRWRRKYSNISRGDWRLPALLSPKNCNKPGAKILDSTRFQPAGSTDWQGQPAACCSGRTVYRVLFSFLHLARAAALLHRRRPDEPVWLLEQAVERADQGQRFLLVAVLSSFRRRRVSNPLRDL